MGARATLDDQAGETHAATSSWTRDRPPPLRCRVVPHPRGLELRIERGDVVVATGVFRDWIELVKQSRVWRELYAQKGWSTDEDKKMTAITINLRVDGRGEKTEIVSTASPTSDWQFKSQVWDIFQGMRQFLPGLPDVHGDRAVDGDDYTVGMWILSLTVPGAQARSEPLPLSPALVDAIRAERGIKVNDRVVLKMTCPKGHETALGVRLARWRDVLSGDDAIRLWCWSCGDSRVATGSDKATIEQQLQSVAPSRPEDDGTT